MSRIKNHFHEEICSRANEEPCWPETSEEEIAKFYADLELEKAKDLVAAASRLEGEKNGLA